MLLDSIQISFRFAVVLAMLSLLIACAKTEREEALHQRIKQAAGLAERHDIRGLLDLTQEGFIVDPGGYTSPDVRRILFVTFKRYGKFRIHYPQPTVMLSEDEETATVKMHFLIATEDRSLPKLEQLYKDPEAWLMTVDRHADIYTLSVEFGFKSGNWLAKKARISSFGRPHGQM